MVEVAARPEWSRVLAKPRAPQVGAWGLVWNVTPALHTPLMSVTNAISGIIVLGAILQMQGSFKLATVFAFVAVLLATINIAGGFYVTQRMLSMFRKQD